MTSNAPRYYSCLDDTDLAEHTDRISVEELKALIRTSIKRVKTTYTHKTLSYDREGKELFQRFRKHYDDPAETALKLRGRNYRDVGRTIFQQKQGAMLEKNSRRLYSILAEYSAAYSCVEFLTLVLEVLEESPAREIKPPDESLDSFGEACRQAGLLDESGTFDDPYRLISLFCGSS